MKKIITILVLIITISASAIAGDEINNPRVTNSFQEEFNEAQEVKWVLKENIYMVTFSYENKFFTAYYNKKGSRLGLSRNMLVTELPELLQKEVKQDYKKFWISGLLELSDYTGTNYFLVLENSKMKFILVSNGETSWEFLKTILPN